MVASRRECVATSSSIRSSHRASSNNGNDIQEPFPAYQIKHKYKKKKNNNTNKYSAPRGSK